MEYLKLLDREKSIQKKTSIINKLIESISFIPKINSIHFLDDLDFQIPWIYYFFIKAQPLRLYSNKRFLQLYTNDKPNQNRLLNLLSSIYESLKELRYNNFLNVTFEEFQKKCDDSSKS